MQLRLHTFRLALKHRFTISRRSFDHQENLVVELRDDQGHVGYGEATANSYYPNSEVAVMRQKLEALRSRIENFTLQNAPDFWDYMAPALADCPFALCALDVAAHDLCARRAGLPLYQYWGFEARNTPISCYTLSINPLEIMIERMKEMPWPKYKVKLGRDNDLEIIRGLRQHTDAAIRVDANCAWNATETIEKSKILANLGVEFIEQPLPAEDWEGMAQVFAHSPLPLIADESCKGEEELETCVGHFHGVNIKLMKCGGFSPALRMIKRAKALQLKVMVGCMTESTVGISAIAQLLPLIDFIDMDGPLFLEKDIASGVEVTASGAVFPDRPGTGVILLDH